MNIMVTERDRVKVLDFGLPSSSNLSHRALTRLRARLWFRQQRTS